MLLDIAYTVQTLQDGSLRSDKGFEPLIALQTNKN